MTKGKFQIYPDLYTLEMFDLHPKALFVFGDNMQREGYGGQAAVCRDHERGLGVVTCHKPGIGFTDCLNDLAILADEFNKVAIALEDGQDVFWPNTGIGNGIANLPNQAPLCFRFIELSRDVLLKFYPGDQP
jgi:hypothetical protein